MKIKKSKINVVHMSGYNITVDRTSADTVVVYSKAPAKPDPNQMKLF